MPNESTHMFVIRQALADDVPTLLKLAKMVHSNNLPPQQDIILSKVRASRRSFAGKIEDRAAREYLFVIEDTESGNVIGCSSIIAAMGGPERPHLYFEVQKREHYSTDLQTGQVHATLQLRADESGPTEIGGLVLSPAYRGHPSKLGSLLSLVRFHYIGLHREQFGDRVIAEMMGPLTPDSHNTLWEYLGRRFINLTYAEADRFSRSSKEFILSLFPREEIYVSLLPPEARALIARVGQETEPALAMLKRLGFEYHNHIDPFDGGPYLEVATDDVTLVKMTRRMTVGEPTSDCQQHGFVSHQGDNGFRAVRTAFAESDGTLSLAPETMSLLGVSVGDEVGLTPRAARSPGGTASTAEAQAQ